MCIRPMASCKVEIKAAQHKRMARIKEQNEVSRAGRKGVETKMKFYFAMIEIDDKTITVVQGRHLALAMNELKASCTPGKCAYYEVSLESQYRRAEREIKAQAK